MMQPDLLQSYKDEFELDQHGLIPHMPAETGSVLDKKSDSEVIGRKEHSQYQLGAGKWLHMP
eukprot:10257052-Ditylum_brightwellii.AAC.2